MGINEGIAGVFYVLSGVIFPITALPGWAQSISKVLPITYWMEAVRRALAPGIMDQLGHSNGFDITGMVGFNDMFLMVDLIVSAAIAFGLSILIFRYADLIARRKGKIDWTSAY
jgi:ABC-type polysaccharide/polyol phosphate export permease